MTYATSPGAIRASPTAARECGSRVGLEESVNSSIETSFQVPAGIPAAAVSATTMIGVSDSASMCRSRSVGEDGETGKYAHPVFQAANAEIARWRESSVHT